MSTADQLHLQAIAQAQQGHLSTAAQLWQRALQQDPQHFLSWQNLAIAQHKAYDFANAAQSNQRALLLTTDSESQANLHLNLGAALAKLKDFDGAIASYQSALKRKPNWYSAKRNLGNVLALKGDLLPAETILREVLRQEPNDGENYHGLGNVMREQGRYEDALVFFQQAIALNPNFAEAHCNLALLKMLLGNWIDGAAEYEWRLRCPDMLRLLPTVPFPLWQGEPLQGKTLMLYGDLGLGDCLNFMRYATLLENQGAQIVLHLPKSLVAIAQTLPGTPRILSQSTNIDWRSPEHSTIHHWCPLLSMVHRFRTTPTTIPASIPYLQAPGDRPPQTPAPKHRANPKKNKL